MDEDSKKVLYKQLVEMYENNNNKDEQPIIAENEYLQLLAKDALAYILNYRENADFGLDDNGQKNIFYIELPDMDLSGEDLSHLRIKEFIPGTFDEYGMLTASYIDLQDTNALVDLNDIGYTRSEENETGVTDYIIDFELMNFNGCDIYGILPDEYAEYEDDLKSKLKSKIITQNKEGHLDERYIQRRKEEHLSKEEKARSDKAYKRIMSGNSVKGMRGVNDGTINLNDYDFSELNDEQMEALKLSLKDYFIETNDIELIENVGYFGYLNSYEKEKILEQALRFGKMDFVEKYFEYLSYHLKETILITKLEQNDIEYVEKHFKNLNYYEKNQIVKRALELGKIDFLEKHFKDLSYHSKEIILITKLEQNDNEYVEKHFKYLEIDEKTKIVEKALEIGKMDFVEKNFIYLRNHSKETILITKLEQNDTEYVEKHFKHMGRVERIKIAEKASELGNIDFVEKHFEDLDYRSKNNSRSKILIRKLEENDIEYLEKNFEYLDLYEKDSIVKRALELGKIDFLEKHFKDLSYHSKEIILITKLEQNDNEYVEKHFKHFDRYEKPIILKKVLELGNIDFVEKHFENLDHYDKNTIVKRALELDKMEFVEKYFYYSIIEEIMKKALELDKMDFVKNHFKDLPIESQEEIILKIKEPQKCEKIVNDFVEEEKARTEIIGKKEQSCSGKILYKVLSQEKINEELIYELIKAGSNVNYINYENNKNYGYNQVIYTPILMKTIEITDVEQKNRIIRALIEAGVNVNAEKLELNYYRNGERTTKRQKATDDKDLQEILNENNKENKENEISNFLKQEINLSEEEIAKLEETFQNYGNSIYDKSFEELKLQKKILSAVNCEKESFTDCARILFLKPEVIYSRLKFFTENGIIIEKDRLQETLGSTNKTFAKRFGKRVLPIQTIDLNDTQYPAELKRELLQRYPMPRKKEELKVELDKVSEKYKGRESD